MNLIETLKSALQSLFSNKVRSLLTMLGIIIGISSVIIITMVGRGSQDSITGDLKDAVDRTSIIKVVSEDEPLRRTDYFNENDLAVIGAMTNVEAITPEFNTRMSLAIEGENGGERVKLASTVEDFSVIENISMLYGREFTSEEINNAEKVILLDDIFAMRKFNRINVAGEVVTLMDRESSNEYVVVGVFEHPMKSLMATMGREEYFPYVPYTTYQRYISDSEIGSIKVMFSDLNQKDQAAADIVSYMENAHDKEDIYEVDVQNSPVGSVNEILSTVSLLLTAVATISLLVGGIGVMNIMLVTVTERTREIGIRKALGAKNRDILIQFMIEASVLTLTGGAFGIVLGYVVSIVIGDIINVIPILSTSMLIVSVTVSGGIGIIFGTFPAKKAAELNPIDALRHE